MWRTTFILLVVLGWLPVAHQVMETSLQGASLRVRRTVHVSVRAPAQRSSHVDYEPIIATAVGHFGPHYMPTAELQSCSVVPLEPRGRKLVDALTLDLGRQFDMQWSTDQGGYVGQAPGGVHDLAWQPVGLWSSASPTWGFYLDDALQFGERPQVTDVETMGDGTLVVRWTGDYDDLSVRLVGNVGGDMIHCPSRNGELAVPAGWTTKVQDWQLQATREEQHLLADGTFVVGRASLLVPVRVEQSKKQGQPVGSSEVGKSVDKAEQKSKRRHLKGKMLVRPLPA